MVVLIPTFYLLRYEHLLHKVPYYSALTAPSYKERVFPKLTPNQSLMLGGGQKHDHPKSSYIGFPQHKNTGTIRIGIFGCSFVQGAEIAKGHDFPSLLQHRFNCAGIKNVEVINFGLTGRGVHHMYMFWEFLGKDYILDYVVFMPFFWHMSRDSSFEEMRARYIIKDGTLKLIPVIGTTLSEAFEIYYRLIPPWRYIRYDYSMPLFLKALLPSILQNRSNPFYYKLSNEDEILTTYEMLFNKLSDQVDNLVIIATDDIIYSLRENVHSPNVYFMKSQTSKIFKSFLYSAPHNHNSFLGNQIRANELFSLFIGHDKPKLDIIELSYNLNSSKTNFTSSSFPLYKYNHISANIDQHPIASFIIDISKDMKRPYFYGEAISFQKFKIASLLLMPTTDINCIKFAPLPFLLSNKELVFLTFKVDNELIKSPIGIMNAPAGVVGELLVNLDGQNSFAKSDDWFLEIKDGNIFLQANTKIKDVSIMMGEKEILKGVPSSRSIIFKSVIADYVFLRAKKGQFIDINTLKEKEGFVDLVLRDKKSQKERYPIFLYKIRPANTSQFNPAYPNPILQKN